MPIESNTGEVSKLAPQKTTETVQETARPSTAQNNHQTPQEQPRKIKRVIRQSSHWTFYVRGRPELTKLKRLVLKGGGSSFQRNDFLVFEIDRRQANDLDKNGKFFDGRDAFFVQMEERECHTNSLFLSWITGCEAWTGLALSDDGVWRVHSWCFARGWIIETTVPRKRYFGVRTFHPEDFVDGVHGLLAVGINPSARTVIDAFEGAQRRSELPAQKSVGRSAAKGGAR